MRQGKREKNKDTAYWKMHQFREQVENVGVSKFDQTSATSDPTKTRYSVGDVFLYVCVCVCVFVCIKSY